MFLPVVADWLIVWAILTLVIRSGANRGAWHSALWLSIATMLPFASLKSWAFYSLTVPSRTWSHALFFGGLAVDVALLAGLRRSAFRRLIERLTRLTSRLLLILSYAGILIFAELLWFGARAGTLNTSQCIESNPHIGSASPPPHRVFWIVFDELSYQQVYGERFSTLQLPSFDALAAQSTVFLHATPAGFLTERVVPTLFSGKAVHSIHSSASGLPSFQLAAGSNSSAFNPYETVFQDAKDAGYSTSVVGWYNPYCRILSSVLDHCLWSFDAPLQNGLIPHAGLLSNMLAPLKQITGSASLSFLPRSVRPRSAAVVEANLHARDLASLVGASDAVLRDPTATFVFLHFPVPHVPGIYNRREHRIVSSGSDYLDNLALADACLAHIREVLTRAGQWNSSTVVLMGDHGWRVSIWRARAGWTAEEEQASHGGQFDDRPVYMVKLANQHAAFVIHQPFPAQRTRALLDAIMQERLVSPSNLERWVANPGDGDRR